MVHVIEFTSATFDVSRETPNPINPIAGKALLAWLRMDIVGAGYEATEPDAEDWGWYIRVKSADGAYLVGASGENDGSAAETDWVVQIHKQRKLMEKIAGRNKMTADDPLSALIERCIRDDAGSKDIHVDRDG